MENINPTITIILNQFGRRSSSDGKNIENDTIINIPQNGRNEKVCQKHINLNGLIMSYKISRLLYCIKKEKKAYGRATLNVLDLI